MSLYRPLKKKQKSSSMYRFLYLLVWSALLLSILSCKVQHLASTEVEYIQTTDYTAIDASIDSLIAPYREEMSAEMDEVLGTLPETLIKSRPNSNMGNWFCDVLLTEANSMFFNEVDITMQNYGGLRLPSLAEGPLTKGEVYELMPFDNTLVVIEVKGSLLRELVNAINDKGGWPISKTLSYKQGSKASEIKVHGKDLDDQAIYRLGIPDYVANGGDQAHFLKHIPQEESGVYIRDIIISHLEDLRENKSPIIIDNEPRVLR